MKKTTKTTKQDRTAVTTTVPVTYTLDAVAKAMNVNPWTVREWVRSGELRALSLPAANRAARRADPAAKLRRILIAAEDFADFIQRHRD